MDDSKERGVVAHARRLPSAPSLSTLSLAARRFPLALAPFRPRSAFRRLLRAFAISSIAAWRTSVLLLRR